jgi:hypothetical protein
MQMQTRLPLTMPVRQRQRSVRRPFHPSKGEGPYRLPNDVRNRLTAALAGFRNRDAAFALAVFLARFWSSPGRIVEAFPIDRRALADHPELQLTEKRVRGAIRTLEEVSFLDRAVASGSRYKATEEGLRRKPILFRFGSEYASAFSSANRRAAAARSGRSGERRAIISPSNASRPSVAVSVASDAKGPKNRNPSERTVLMGPVVKENGLPPQASEPNPRLEAALDRLLQGIRQRRGSGEDSA